MDAENYQQTLKELEAAGAGSPEGRLYHVAFGSPIQVLDVWESQEKFDAFGQTLIPILQGAGID
ncbi:MAG: hypothetical protein QOK47_424, partial [Actinomycetota bacterium]|nr:hypothetical protein [Actinomycetota bacterium]